MGALMMPRLVRPSDASRIALAAGASLMVDDLRTLRPMPCSSGCQSLVVDQMLEKRSGE